MRTTEDWPCAVWHRALESGVTVVEGKFGHLYILGPSGSEPLARELRAAAPGVIHRLITLGCGCGGALDEAYRFGDTLGLFQPGPFSRAEYVALAAIRHRFSQGDRVARRRLVKP